MPAGTLTFAVITLISNKMQRTATLLQWPMQPLQSKRITVYVPRCLSVQRDAKHKSLGQ